MKYTYANVVFLQGSDDFEEFERVAFPENPEPDFIEKDAAMEYLMQWEQGEATSDEVFGECKTDFPFCFRGHIGEQDTETETHVAVWNRSYGVAGLWRKIPEFIITVAVTDNALMDDQFAEISIHGIGTIHAQKVSESATVYVERGAHSAITTDIDAIGWARLAKKLARQFNLTTGKVQITWKHEGPGKPRGKAKEFDL